MWSALFSKKKPSLIFICHLSFVQTELAELNQKLKRLRGRLEFVTNERDNYKVKPIISLLLLLTEAREGGRPLNDRRSLSLLTAPQEFSESCNELGFMNKDQAKAEDLKRQQMEVGVTLKPDHRPAAVS
jgi:hypothetical protein